MMETTEKKPKVSVCVVTYNHEKYIRQCLQSIVDQETNFDFEVVVGEDCSTDGTRAIVLEFAEKYPTLVKLILHQKNVGGTRNYLAICDAAVGEYIATIDGDDCALPGKLQIQSDCLDLDQDVSFAVHAVKIMGTGKVMGEAAKYPAMGTLEDLLMLGTYFVNSSVMFRKKHEFVHSNQSELVDYYLHIERASRGKIFLDRRILGCYRVHARGMSQNMEYRDRLENCYETAFDRALELGASKAIVQSGRLKKRMVFSVTRYLSGDVDGYKNKIKINKDEFFFASKKHLILHWTRFLPGLVGIYSRIRGLA